MKADVSTLVRTGALAAALVNQLLVLTGHNTLPFTEEEITEGLTAALTAAASLWTWWKNNSFTMAAREADLALRKAKEQKSLPRE